MTETIHTLKIACRCHGSISYTDSEEIDLQEAVTTALAAGWSMFDPENCDVEIFPHVRKITLRALCPACNVLLLAMAEDPPPSR